MTNLEKNQKVGILIRGQLVDAIVLRPGRFRSTCQWKVKWCWDEIEPYDSYHTVGRVWNRRIYD